MSGEPSHPHVVVVGAGQAGIAVVAKLRGLGFGGAITLIGAEDVLPYQRPPLSKKYLLGALTVDRLLLRPRAFYDSHRVTVRLGCPVTKIDIALRCVEIGSDTVPYDRLVLATGTAARMLPAEQGGALPGVYVMRTIADIDAMAAEFQPGRRVLIVGGGYIGLEAAAVAATKGLLVTVVEAGPRILSRVAAAETSAFFRDLHASHGVTVAENVSVTRLMGERHGIGALLANGATLRADFVIVGIGVFPQTALAQAAGLTCTDGIAVDEYGRTSVTNVWAAGDCTSFPFHAGRVRLECVQNAVEQAETVAADIIGRAMPYDPVPWFWSDQFDIKLQIAGLNAGHDEIVTRVYPSGAMSVWYYRQGTFCAVDAMNDPRAFLIGKQLLRTGRTPARAQVADLGVNLKSFVE